MNQTRTILAAGAACLFGLACLSATPVSVFAAEQTTLIGLASVRDGDTITIGKTAIRLKGVDAAERGTPRGEEARDYMLDLIAENPVVECRLTGEKTWDRSVGFCTPYGKTDISDELGAQIIAAGLALACPRYSERYLPFEASNAVALQPRSSYCIRRSR